jgi:glucose/arabinose dehydrogenase
MKGYGLRKLWLITLLGWLVITSAVRGQNTLPPCEGRRTHVDPPWVDGAQWCLEQVTNDAGAGELAFTALAAAPDGVLYAARPLRGQILALTDSDGDGLPDTPRIVAEGLTRPNGLAYADGALYISGGAHIYRLKGDRVEVLVNDVPAGGGFWTGSLTVGPDKRLYIGVSAPCDFCEPADKARGAILSYALNGGDRQMVAHGLRYPADLVFRDGVLWTMDSARDRADQPNLDELNRVTPGAFFGWPYCIGADNRRDWPNGDFDCAQAAPPALTFPTHSTPWGLALYNSDTFPAIKGHLLVVLGGSYNQPDIEGYSLATVRFDDRGKPTEYHIIMPEQAYSQIKIPPLEIHYKGSGFWPHHPYDVTVSREGWIYVSVGGGRILALRPNS